MVDGILLLVIAAAIDPVFLGQTAGLAISLAVLWRFATGKILARNTVPREDYDAAMKVNADLVATIPPLTASVQILLDRERKNGGR